jgi:hypothetical protein
MQNNCSRILLFLICFGAATPAFAEPRILTRGQWQAKPVLGEMQQHKPVAILVHHTGSAMKPKTALVKKMQSLQRFSQAKEKLADGRIKPAWPDVPYHFYIDVNGAIAEGRSITAVGDTNTGYDPKGFVQVVVEGNFDTEKITSAQVAALTAMLKELKKTYTIKNSAILAHNDKAQTACPGKDLTLKLKEILKDP